MLPVLIVIISVIKLVNVIRVIIHFIYLTTNKVVVVGNFFKAVVPGNSIIKVEQRGINIVNRFAICRRHTATATSITGTPYYCSKQTFIHHFYFLLSITFMTINEPNSLTYHLRHLKNNNNKN